MSVDTPDAARSAPSRAMPALMSSCVVVVVAMVAAINLALPKLSGSDLHPNSTELLWIVDAYILVFGCLLIPAGALGDRIGRKGVLLAGLGVFAVGCLFSAAAPNVTMLLAGRVVTGLGAALVMPATLSLLMQVTPPERKPHAIATWTAATGAAGALGTLGGGLVLQWLPWQGLFLVIGPLALLLAVAVVRVAPRGERHRASLDLVGTALLTATVFALLFGIIEGPDHGWTSALVLGSFAAATLLFALFLTHALRGTHPLLDPRVFAIAKLRTGTIGVAAVFFGLFALFFVNAQYLQYAKGYSPLVTGLAILPLPIGMIAISRRSVAIARRIGTRTVVTGGMILLAAGLAALSYVTSATPYPPYGLALLAISTGMGLSVPTLSTGIMTSLPPARAGMGSGLNSATREIGAALGVAVVGTILTSHFANNLPTSLQEHADSTSQTLGAAQQLGPTIYTQAVNAFTDAMAAGYRATSVIVLIAAVAVALGLRRRRPQI
ncbi:MFS transporter [Pseudofrankia sp. BMG5.36]|uniref:MFS transporter n=1 Tax=Pseudofrankia sp. BMG5.36 TaxID=1834512 RepID=UPI0008D9B422|nr:MFS transporter [Pseudofrankia sp. BMG5.36]OHV55359.1 MFS transporter [Pseudofrankia sp. BMG5.36]